MRRSRKRSDPTEREWFAAVGALECCVLCGAYGIEVAHRDEGKGMGLKTKPHMTAALCHACHYEIGNGKTLSREERRSLMDRAIVLTHDALALRGVLTIQDAA